MDTIFYTGVVEDVMDPSELGRARVRIFGIHSLDLTDIPTESLPWATVLTPVTSASGGGAGMTPHFIPYYSWVLVYFLDGEDKQQPLIMGTLPGYTNEYHTYTVNGVPVPFPGSNRAEVTGALSGPGIQPGDEGSIPISSNPGSQVVSYDEFGNPITRAQSEGKVGLDAFGDNYKVTDSVSNLTAQGLTPSQQLEQARRFNNQIQPGDELIDEFFSGGADSPNRPGENR